MANVFTVLFSLMFYLGYPALVLASEKWSLNQVVVESGDLDDKNMNSINGGIIGRVFDNNFLQLDLEYTKFKHTELEDVTLYFIHRKANGLLALGYKHQELNVFKSDHAILHYQRYQDEFFTVVTALGYEDKNISDNFAYGALYLRLYPLQSLMLQSGISAYDSFKGNFDSGEVNLDFQAEWQLTPKQLANFSLFYTEDLFGKRTVGIRFRLDQRTLLAIHRSTGILGF